MKTIITHTSTLLADITGQLPAIRFSWSRVSHYTLGALRQAFRDNVLSEIEMEFLLLMLTGFVVSVKNGLGKYITVNNGKKLTVQSNLK